MSASYDKQRILRNTLLLYGRMLLTVGLNLLATRLTLQHLGVEDLGVYGVVGTVVTMFGVFVSGIVSAVQRFISFELGRGDEASVNRVFCTSLNVLLLFGIALSVLAEVIGLWLLHYHLNIPSASLSAAYWVLHFTVVVFFFNIISIPYNALVIAYERMNVFAMISVLQVALTCLAAWSLSLMAQSQRLIVYGAAMAVIAVLVRLSYQVYCHRRLSAARYHWHIDKGEMLEMARFAGVSTLSGVFQTISGEGLSLVINLTFGVAINAVYAIALQLKNMVLSFALNLFKAIQPQITKTYAEGSLDAHRTLVCSGSKFEVCLIYFLMLPFLFRTEQIMQLWLGDVPPFAVAFVQGTIFISLTYAAFEPIRTAVLATGRITRFLLIPDGAYLLVLPIAWLVARSTGSPVMMLLSIVLTDVAACALRVVLGAQVSPVSLRDMLHRIILPCLVVAVLDAAVCYLLSRLLPLSLLGLIAVVFFNAIALIALIFVVGLTSAERSVVRKFLHR